MIQLGLDQEFVGRRDFVAENVFDDLVALVETMLDQWIAGERANDIEAGDLRFVSCGDLRVGGRTVTRSS